MSYPVVTIDERALLTEAISLMIRLKIRRLLVVRREKAKEVQLVLVTLMSLIGNVPTESLDLAEIDSPLGKVVQKLVSNVYVLNVNLNLVNKADLSKHIDRIRVRKSDAFEDDVRLWQR
jgi:CBS domain-containing protein